MSMVLRSKDEDCRCAHAGRVWRKAVDSGSSQYSSAEAVLACRREGSHLKFHTRVWTILPSFFPSNHLPIHHILHLQSHSSSIFRMSRRNRKDVDDLLADLDNLGTEQQPSKPPRKSADKSASSAAASGDIAGSGSTKTPEDAQSLLDDLDSLVQSRASTSSRASQRKKDDALAASTTPVATPVKTAPEPAASAALEASSVPATAALADNVPAESNLPASTSGGGGWAGWGSSLFSQATKLADQARQEFEKRAPTQAEQARELGSKGWDLAKGVRGFVKEANLERWGEEVTKVGKRGWTDIVNAVAPPIAAHEIIQVTLSHDMIGYDGISDVTYQVLAKVMEQVDSSGTEQQLIVNKAQIETPASKPKTGSEAGQQDRDLNAVEGFPAAFRLARVNLDECIKQHEVAAPHPKSADQDLPITTCPVFVRIQACLADLPGEAEEPAESNKSLFFLVLLRDPQHGLSHKTVSQAVPTSWRESIAPLTILFSKCFRGADFGSLSVRLTCYQSRYRSRRTNGSKSRSSTCFPTRSASLVRIMFRVACQVAQSRPRKDWPIWRAKSRSRALCDRSNIVCSVMVDSNRCLLQPRARASRD